MTYGCFRPLLGAFLSRSTINQSRRCVAVPCSGIIFYGLRVTNSGKPKFPSPSRGLFFIQKKLTKRLSLVCCRPLLGDYFLLSVQKVETDEVEGFRPLRGAYFLSCPCKPACSKALHRILRRSPCHSPLTSVFFTAQPLPTQSASGAVHHFSFNDVRTAPIPSAVLIPMPQ